mmetsp:Transcript_34894/g.96303  ORF Transcript_34894/g.96303 Transcript_34894/m.96303 type:complete len:462 (+) Transcript_34894:77-1462(+)
MAAALEQMVDCLDAERAISEFLADPSRVSLKLPPMSAKQRKQAKTVADKHPELRCGSYGFGAERQLHLFKATTVFGAASPLCQEPSAMLAKRSPGDDQVSSRCKGECALGHLRVDMSPLAEMTAAAAREASLDRSTTASASGSEGASPYEESSSSSPRYVHLSPAPLQVKNTFVHFQGASADERAVQSMPHGMFRHNLLTEAMEGRPHNRLATLGFGRVGTQVSAFEGHDAVAENYSVAEALASVDARRRELDAEEAVLWMRHLASQAPTGRPGAGSVIVDSETATAVGPLAGAATPADLVPAPACAAFGVVELEAATAIGPLAAFPHPVVVSSETAIASGPLAGIMPAATVAVSSAMVTATGPLAGPGRAPRGFVEPGMEVVLEGLAKCPTFNGRSGKVKRENLRQASWCPASSSPLPPAVAVPIAFGSAGVCPWSMPPCRPSGVDRCTAATALRKMALM